MLSSKIRILNDHTINKIAAGEVIENPASVVKELVENSLDAGSSTICVEIMGGGRELIRVSDDGYGMDHDDALLCVERHATSKIREVEDIQDLLTMGFRGEAIPSIAAISKFQLLTTLKQENQTEKGTLILIEAGTLRSCSSAPRSPGTTIEVKSLFYNVPVRRKFQRSPQTDTAEILKLINHLALAYPHVHFELISDQKTILKTHLIEKNLSFQELLSHRIENILGKEIYSSLTPLQFEKSPFKLSGFIGHPWIHKPNRTGQQLFLNRRFVYSPLISGSVREGYGTMLPQNRYPLFILHLELPGSLVDVNVHPQKKEVRLRQEQHLKETIIHAIQTTLRREQQEVIYLPPEEKSPPYFLKKREISAPEVAEEKWEFRTFPSNSDVPPPLQKILEAPTFIPVTKVPRVLETLRGYFILDPFSFDSKTFSHFPQQLEGGLVLLDHRAAITRIHYEKLLKQETTNETQSLLVPFTWQCTSSETSIIHEHLLPLNQMGFGIREFGEGTFLIDSIPLFLKEDQIQECLTLLIQDLVELNSSRILKIKLEEQLALAASRVSISTKKRLSIEEAQAIVYQLMQCEFPSQCPKGKPTCIYFTTEEMAKWFQRDIMKF